MAAHSSRSVLDELEEKLEGDGTILGQSLRYAHPGDSHLLAITRIELDASVQ